MNKIVFDKKGLEEIVELFEDKYRISVEDIKGKYIKSEKLELRNKFIKKEVGKCKAINQVELAKLLNISSHLVSNKNKKLTFSIISVDIIFYK